MTRTVRENELKAFVDEEKRFIGHALRHSPVYNGEELVAYSMLIAPLYVEMNGEFIFVDHAWVQLPNHLLQMNTYIFDFNGIVKRRKTNTDKVFIEFKEINTITKFKDEYEGVSMKTIDIREEVNLDARREKFLNHSVIKAYELGQELPKKESKGDGTASYLQLMTSIKNGRYAKNKYYSKGRLQARKRS